RRDIQDREGRIIASWEQYGEVTVGEPGVAFDETVTGARDDAARAVNEARVPRRYHESILEYVDRLPDAAKETRRRPAAPRSCATFDVRRAMWTSSAPHDADIAPPTSLIALSI